MRLVESLASGIKGAESGTAELYERGTSTRATWYQDFEGTSAVADGADIALDANGGAEVYVDQYVDLVVKDASGSTVRQFTTGGGDSSTEVRSTSFTGTDYTSGASAAGNPVDLRTVLDKWLTSAGTTDFNVLQDGSATTLQDAIQSKVFFNVKDYGATGDGTTDDLNAINSAEAAADDVGGILYFPAGTYRTTSRVTLSTGVNVFGDDPETTIINLDTITPTVQTFVYQTGAAFGNAFIKNLTFKVAQSSSAAFIDDHVSSTITKHVVVENCYFDATNKTGVQIQCGTLSNHNWIIKDCKFENMPVGASVIASEPLNRGRLLVQGCYFDMTDNMTSGSGFAVTLSSGVIMGNYFDCSAMATGTSELIRVEANGDGIAVVGNTFTADGGATVYAFDFEDPDDLEDPQFVEYGNSINLSGGVVADADYNDTTVSTTVRGRYFGSRVGKAIRYQTNGNVTIDPSLAEIIVVEVTGSSASVIAANLLPTGNRLTLLIYNTSGGVSGNLGILYPDFITQDSMTSPELFTLPDDEYRIFECVSLGVRESATGTDVQGWLVLSDSGAVALQIA